MLLVARSCRRRHFCRGPLEGSGGRPAAGDRPARHGEDHGPQARRRRRCRSPAHLV